MVGNKDTGLFSSTSSTSAAFNIIFLAGRVSLRYAILDEGPDDFDGVDHAMVRRLTQEDDTFRLERFIYDQHGLLGFVLLDQRVQLGYVEVVNRNTVLIVPGNKPGFLSPEHILHFGTIPRSIMSLTVPPQCDPG